MGAESNEEMTNETTTDVDDEATGRLQMLRIEVVSPAMEQWWVTSWDISCSTSVPQRAPDPIQTSILKERRYS